MIYFKCWFTRALNFLIDTPIVVYYCLINESLWFWFLIYFAIVFLLNTFQFIIILIIKQDKTLSHKSYMSQLQMVIAGYITQLWTCYHTAIISAMESPNCVYCLSPWIVPMSCLCPHDKAAFLWRVIYH
jgi:hypothetical protein